jgi:hypothetical protein
MPVVARVTTKVLALAYLQLDTATDSRRWPIFFEEIQNTMLTALRDHA